MYSPRPGVARLGPISLSRLVKVHLNNESHKSLLENKCKDAQGCRQMGEHTEGFGSSVERVEGFNRGGQLEFVLDE